MVYVVRLTPDEMATILAALETMGGDDAAAVGSHLRSLSGVTVEGEWKSGKDVDDVEETG